MNRLYDQITLFLAGCFSFFLITYDTEAILCIFLALVFLTFSYAFPDRRFSISLLILYGLMGLKLPSLCLFMPLYIYISMTANCRWTLLFGIPGIILSLLNAPPALIILMLFSLLLAIYLWWRTVHEEVSTKTLLQKRDDSTELSEKLKAANQKLLLQQNQQIDAATLKERNRIAREIHDNVGHLLSRSILMTGAMKTINHQDSLAQPLADLNDTLNSAMNRIRESVHDLRDESINLKDAVTDLTQNFEACPVSLSYDVSLMIPKEVKYCFITILKEALTNVIRHSNASHVNVVLREHPAMYQLIISDNGTKAVHSAENGMGLSNMKSRVHALHGHINFKRENGFEIFVTIPKAMK